MPAVADASKVHGMAIVATRENKYEAQEAKFEFDLLMAVAGSDLRCYYYPTKSTQTGRWCYAICVGASAPGAA